MKLPILIMVLCMALAIAEANVASKQNGQEQIELKRNFGGPSPEQSAELVADTLIQNVARNPIEDFKGVYINGHLGKPNVKINSLKPILGKPDVSIVETTEKLESAERTFEEVDGCDDEEVALNGIAGKPDVNTDHVVVPIKPIIETLQNSEEILITSNIKNPFEEVIGSYIGKLLFHEIVGQPDFEINSIFDPIISKPDVEIDPVVKPLESAEESLINSSVINPFEEVIGNSNGELIFNGSLGKPDFEINSIFNAVISEPDVEIDPVVDPLESAGESLINSSVINPFEEFIGNSNGEIIFNGIILVETSESAEETHIKSLEVNGTSDVKIDPTAVSIVGNPDVQIDSHNDTLEPAEETLIKSDIQGINEYSDNEIP